MAGALIKHRGGKKGAVQKQKTAVGYKQSSLRERIAMEKEARAKGISTSKRSCGVYY